MNVIRRDPQLGLPTRLYEQGLPAEHRRDFLCAAPSMGLHESQSRLWESLVGSRSRWCGASSRCESCRRPGAISARASRGATLRRFGRLYAIGNLYAAGLFAAARRTRARRQKLRSCMAIGERSPLRIAAAMPSTCGSTFLMKNLAACTLPS